MEKSQMVCVKTVLDPSLLTLASLPSPPRDSSTLPQRPASLWLALCPSMRVRSTASNSADSSLLWGRFPGFPPGSAIACLGDTSSGI